MPIIISLQDVLTKLLQKENGAVFLPHSVLNITHTNTLHHLLQARKSISWLESAADVRSNDIIGLIIVRIAN